MRRSVPSLALVALVACSDDGGGTSSDAAAVDAAPDALVVDARAIDAGCVDDCDVDEVECTTSTAERTCGQFDSDACRDWSPSTACIGGEMCVLGSCGGGHELSVVPLAEGTTPADYGTVTSTPAGILCGRGGSMCQQVFASGTSVTLTATSDATARFYGWTLVPLTGHTNGAACMGSTAPCTVSMTEVTTLGAAYCTPECVVGASRCPGVSTAETCGEYDDDPCPEWGPATACSGGQVCTASGCATGFVVTATTSGAGEVAIDGVTCATVPCSRGVATGGSAVITATAAPHTVFANWTGACTGTGGCTMTAAGTATARFADRCVETETWLTDTVDTLAVTPTHLYWSFVSDLWRAALPSGTGAVFAPSANSSFVADGSSVFYVREAGITYTLQRSDGAAPITLAMPATSGLPGVNATDVYYPNNAVAAGSLRRVPRAGGTSVEVAGALPFTWPEPVEILVDATNAYWFGGGAVVRVPLAGGPTVTLATGQGPIVSVAQDATTLFWARGSDIMRVAKTGGATTTEVANADATAIARNGTALVWVGGEAFPYRPYATTVGSGVVVPLTGLSRAAGGLAVDAGNVYYGGYHNGIISFIGTLPRTASCAP